MTYWAKADNPRPLNAGMRVLPTETARISELVGYDVTNIYGENLGEIADFVIDENGKTPYGVIELGGVLDMYEEWYFVPLQAMTVDRYRTQVILSIDQGTLESIPGYEGGSIPGNGDPGWDAEIREFWRSWTMASFPEEWFRASPAGSILGATAVLSSEIMDYDVRNPERKDIGKIEDIMLDLREARVAYNVLSFGGFLDIGEKLFAVPFKAMIVNPYGEEVIFDVSRKTLQIAPGFDRADWPDTANPLWHEDVDTYWWKAPVT
jgi:sporulation protein YlmC with PRC-barrel domain